MANYPYPPGCRTWEACPVCANARSTPFVAFTALAFVRCDGCGTVYKRFEIPVPRTTARISPVRRFAHRVRRARGRLLDALQFRDAQRLLAVGPTSKYLLEAGKRLGLTSAGTCETTQLMQGALENLPFEDGSFEVVALQRVLEHTPTPLEALKELRRITTERGLLVVSVTNLEYWKALGRRWTYRYFRPDAEGHLRFAYYTQASLARLLREAGFAVVSTGKAVYRRKNQHPSAWLRTLEGIRYGTLWLADAIARGLRLQRELHVIAVKEP